MDSPSPETVKAYAELLTALQWPLVAFIVATVFRRPISRLLGRIKTAKAFGAEANFIEEVERLEEQVEQHTRTLEDKESQPHADNLPNNLAEESPYRELLSRAQEDKIATALEIMESSPEAALLYVASLIESSVFRIAKLSKTPEVRNDTIYRLLHQFSADKILPIDLRSDVRSFMKIRNSVAHGQDASRHDVVRAVDSGIQLWQLMAPTELELAVDSLVQETTDTVRSDS